MQISTQVIRSSSNKSFSGAVKLEHIINRDAYAVDHVQHDALLHPHTFPDLYQRLACTQASRSNTSSPYRSIFQQQFWDQHPSHTQDLFPSYSPLSRFKSRYSTNSLIFDDNFNARSSALLAPRLPCLLTGSKYRSTPSPLRLQQR